ncbi:unnamed protein product [Lactuca virosa]|uniref:DUF4283 domain-containing protein n=1 Tax=Lactuca virosa TaxID=75947 RepID=A0AAU9LTR6_9ASTR|nr:unnamed protein product [Lactuca virosa]
MVWVEIDGLPLSLWTFQDFKKVVALCGAVLFYDEEEEDGIGTGRVCIKSSCFDLIKDQVIVKVEGVDYVVHVRELSAWTPNVNKENEEKDGEEINASSDEKESKGDNGDKIFHLEEEVDSPVNIHNDNFQQDESVPKDHSSVELGDHDQRNASNLQPGVVLHKENALQHSFESVVVSKNLDMNHEGTHHHTTKHFADSSSARSAPHGFGGMQFHSPIRSRLYS